MVNLIGVRIDNKDYITAVFSDEYDIDLLFSIPFSVIIESPFILQFS